MRLFKSLALVIAISCGQACSANEPPNTIADLISRLDHDSFLTREKARQQLIQIALEVGTDDLRRGLTHEAMEVRLATREIIHAVQQKTAEQQLAKFTNPNVPARQLKSHGWLRFSSSAGTDMHARRTFAALARRHPLFSRGTPIVGQDGEAIVDPFRLSGDDSDRWTILLSEHITSNRDQPSARVVTQSARIAMALSNPSLGPKLPSRRHPSTTVIERLISTWLQESNPAHHCPRTRLMIAARYHCDDRAIEICERVFADTRSSPSSVVTAMLVATKLNPGEIDHVNTIDHVIANYTADTRTAHVWQVIADRKTKIRTQVRDVAMALMLHRQNLDPRTFGFEHLEADPLLGFRDHSLGFADEPSRQATLDRAAKVLAASFHP